MMELWNVGSRITHYSNTPVLHSYNEEVIMSYQVVGHSSPRVDNTGKVTGEARYTSDVFLPGTL